MTGYVCDPGLCESLNAARCNYCDVYWDEILGWAGASRETFCFDDLREGGPAFAADALIVGTQSGAALDGAARNRLRDWVRGGGLLVGCGIEGLDDVFGIEAHGLPEPPADAPADAYAVAAFAELRAHPLTREIHPHLFLDQMLPIVSGVRRVKPAGAAELARLYDGAGEDAGCAAVCWNRFGDGFAACFAFDLAKTVWALHQGRPLAPDTPTSLKRPKAHELSILDRESQKVPYADVLCLLLQNMLARRLQAFIHPVPPLDGGVADALLYWGGDEYTGPVENSLRASDWMKSKGLPLHINIQAEDHPMTVEEFGRIAANGHEVSLYWKLHEEDGYDVKAEHFKRQSDFFFAKFGRRPGSTLLFNARWQGWTEPARYMAAAGARADNSFSSQCHRYAYGHDYHNLAKYGFGFGTAYPYYFYEDYTQANRRLDFMEQPIICYELGHRYGMRPEPDDMTRTPEDLHFPIDMAVKYHQVINVFYHPVSILQPNTQHAIDEILRYIRFKQARVVHMTNDQVCDWWDARCRSRVEVVRRDDETLVLKCRTAYPRGIVVKIALPEAAAGARAVSSGAALPAELRREFGTTWLFVVVPEGEREVEVFEETR